MDRIEFLSVLRESLEGCIPLEDVEENITFYRNYFDEAECSEQEVIQELGDPRLIARTIIEAYKASKGPMADYYTEQARSEYSREHSDNDTQESGWSDDTQDNSTTEQIKKWVIAILVIAILLAVLVLALKIFVVFLLPVLLIIFVVKIIIDYFDR